MLEAPRMHENKQCMLCLQSGTPAKHMASARAGMVPKENVNANTGNAPRSTGALRPRPHAGDAAMAELTEQVTRCIADASLLQPDTHACQAYLDSSHKNHHAALHESQHQLYSAHARVQMLYCPCMRR